METERTLQNSGRTYTKEETLHRRLLFANLHYNGSQADAMKRCSEQLKEVLSSDFGDDFKKEFTGLFKDQASKLYETHENWARGLKMQFDALFEKQDA